VEVGDWEHAVKTWHKPRSWETVHWTTKSCGADCTVVVVMINTD